MYLSDLVKFKNSIAGQRALMTISLREDRITSYNVCYTKLLRFKIFSKLSKVCSSVLILKYLQIYLKGWSFAFLQTVAEQL